jgi:transposase
MRMCHESAVLGGTEAESQQTSASELRAQFEAERAMYAQRIAELEQERDRLRASYERLREELELFKRRLFVAKAERIDTTQLQFEYAEKLKELDTLAGTLGLAKGDPDDGDDTKARDGKRYRVLRLPAELVEKQLGEALARVRAGLGAA